MAAILGAAALGAAVGAGTTIYKDRQGFSARHDQSHDSQVALIQALAEKSLQGFLDGNITEEEYRGLEISKQKSIDAGNEYLKSISDYKRTPLFNVIRKAKQVYRVRESKRRSRDQTMEFARRYSGSLSSKTSLQSICSGVSESLPQALNRDDDEFSSAEEIDRVVFPLELGRSLSNLFPEIGRLLMQKRGVIVPPVVPHQDIFKLKFRHMLHEEKALYDQEIYHIVKDFAAFYHVQNYQDRGQYCQGDIRILSELIVTAIILAEMSVTQLASSPDVIKSVSRQLPMVRRITQSWDHQNIEWLRDLEELLNNLDLAFTPWRCIALDNSLNGDEGEEFLKFSMEPVEPDLQSLWPFKLDKVQEIVHTFAEELLRHGNVMMELSLTGVIQSVASLAWRDVLGVTPTPGTQFFELIAGPYFWNFRTAMDNLCRNDMYWSVQVLFQMNMEFFPGATSKFSPLLEGRGTPIFDLINDAGHWTMKRSGTMWFLKVVSADDDDSLFNSTQTIWCPICGYQIAVWYIRTHCETCAEIVLIKNLIKTCNSSISLLYNDARNTRKYITARRPFTSSLLKVFSSRKLLDEISDILQDALDIPVDTPVGKDSNQQTMPLTLEPEILLIPIQCNRVAMSPDIDKMGLTTWMKRAKSVVQQKVDNIARLRNVIRYSRLISSGSQRAFSSLNNFKVIKCLKYDGTVSVFLTEMKPTGKPYVIKVIPNAIMKQKNCVNPHRMTIICQESPFVVKVNARFQSKRSLFLVLEYLGGDCAALSKPLSEMQTKIYIAEVVLAIEFLHRSGIVHRDLKPDNILIDHRGHIKLTDFGISLTNLLSSHIRDTYRANYLAPEVIHQECSHSDSGIDWWALGVITYEFLYGIRPFEADVLETILSNILRWQINWNPTFMNHTSIDALHFVNGLLIPDPEERYGSSGAEQLKHHSFFTGINWDEILTT